MHQYKMKLYLKWSEDGSYRNGRVILGNNNFPICNVYGIDENVYQRMNLVDSIAGIEQNSIFIKWSKRIS